MLEELGGQHIRPREQHQTTIKLVDINAIDKRLQTAKGIGPLVRRGKKRAHRELKSENACKSVKARKKRWG